MDELTQPYLEKKLTLYEARGGSGQTNKAGELGSRGPEEQKSSDENTLSISFSPLLPRSSAPQLRGSHVLPRPLAPSDIPRPPFWGSRVARGISLKDVFNYINETALLKVRWGFSRGKTSAAEYQKLMDEKVQPLFRKWKDYCLKQQLLVPQVVYGYFPCLSDGDDLVIYEPEDLKKEWVRFTFPRQKETPQRCISDFFTPSPPNPSPLSMERGVKTLEVKPSPYSRERVAKPGEGGFDVFGCSIVTVGTQASDKEHKLFKENAYSDYLFLHGLGVETAEALAELWHRRMREELGIAGEDSPNIRDWFHQQYRGGRYSFGYPACPNLEDQKKLFELLDPGRINVSLSEEFQLVPEQSTSAIVVHHPEAKYFNVG